MIRALTERRSEEAKRIRREHQRKFGRDFSPRRGKVLVPRDDGLANCVTATQGLEQLLLEVDDVSEVIRYDFELPVRVRKHEVDVEGIRSLLRSARKESGLTTAQISEAVARPRTEVEHWFRTDDCFSIPEASVWHDLKRILSITTNEFDEQVTEFVTKPGVFEKANRFYSADGIAPTLTSTSANEKIIIDEEALLMEPKKLAGLWGERQAGSLWDKESIAPTIKTPSGGYSQPLIIDEKTKGGRIMTKTNDKPTVTKPFKYVSLFSGIGGFEQALNRLGGTCVMASEIDKFANQAYEVAYGHPTIGDVMKVDAADVPDHDILVGGFPCQAFSVAGKRGGFGDARGTLFFEVARIAKEKQPRLLLLENVKGLVSHDKGKTLDTIVKTMNDIGYRVDFEILNSKYFGVPQNRERIFIVGVREDLIDNQPWDPKGTTIIPKGKRRLMGYEGLKSFNFNWPKQDEVKTKLIDVLEPIVDDSYYLSEEKTAQLVARLEEKDKEDAPNVIHNIYGGFKESKPRVFKDESPTIRTSAGGGHLPSLLEEDNDARGCSTRTRAYADQPEQLEVRKDEVGNALTSVKKDSMVLENGLPIREATKKGYAVAQEGDVVNYKFPDSKTRRGRVGKQIAHTLEATCLNQGVVEKDGCTNNRGELETREISTALDANYFKGVDNHGQRTQVIEKPRYRIRKLTPLECFRLQGFSDEMHEAIKQAGISDSQRYKMAGNAVTVNVIEAIGERLLPLL